MKLLQAVLVGVGPFEQLVLPFADENGEARPVTLIHGVGGVWFSRQPIALSAPARTVARYDVRASASGDDATRSDLARETKQALVYAAIAAALSPAIPAAKNAEKRFDLLEDAMRSEAGEAAPRIVVFAGDHARTH
jgi:hypothetical protein